MATIWLTTKAATKPPIMLPNPPSTQIMKVMGPKVSPMKGWTPYWRLTRQAASESAQTAADRRGQQIDAPLVDAHQPHNFAILGDGADRRAEEGPRQKEVERRGAEQGDDES